MARNYINGRAADVAGLTFDDLYDELRQNWQYKAKALQARRWQALERQAKG